MNDLQIFDYNQSEVRTVLLDGDVWFVAKDICDILELTNPTMALEGLDEDERTKFNLGRQGEANIISESGLYSLVLGSRKPEAKMFKRWITHNVIPQIRKTGNYVQPSMTQAELTLAIAQNQVEIERKTNLALETAEKANAKIDSISDIFTAPIDQNWRHSMNDKINAMCKTHNLNYQVFKGELYKELESKAHCDLAVRQTNQRNRMKKAGFTSAEQKAVSKIDVIERDSQLKEIFDSIVRKYQIKYAM